MNYDVSFVMDFIHEQRCVHCPGFFPTERYECDVAANSFVFCCSVGRLFFFKYVRRIWKNMSCYLFNDALVSWLEKVRSRALNLA